MIKPNESTADRIVRLVIGLLLIAGALFVFTGIVKVITVIASIILLFTALTGFCPLYKLFNISTKK